MAIAQGIYKTLAYKKQAAKGTPSAGSGGQLLRRESATFKLAKATFSADEITSHMQHTGDSFGVRSADGTVNGVMSAGTQTDFEAAVLRADFAAVAPVTGRSITVAGSGPYTLTDSGATWLTSGIKAGSIINLTAGTFNATNLNKNLLVTAVTQTVITVQVVNGSVMTTEGPIASSTVTTKGKKSKAPLTSHTNDYFTIEEFYSNITRSVLYTDVQCSQIDISMPSTGNATCNLSFLGLGQTKSGDQVLTTPTAETTSGPMAAVNGYIMIGGARVVIATSMSLTIDGGITAGESTIGSNTLTDLVKGTIKVSGSFSALYENETIGTMFDDETPVSLVVVVTDTSLAASDFKVYSLGRVLVQSDDPDDGKKQIVKTHSFTAEIDVNGGAALAWDKTILTIQDSTL